MDISVYFIPCNSIDYFALECDYFYFLFEKSFCTPIMVLFLLTSIAILGKCRQFDRIYFLKGNGKMIIFWNCLNFHFLIFSSNFSASANAKPADLEEWVFVPGRNGTIERVNLAEAEIQPYFLVEEDVSFELYTLKNQATPQILSMNNITSITASNFNKKIPTRIYIHGWQEYGGNMKHTFNDGKLKLFDQFL